jgi:hypothetical protein
MTDPNAPMFTDEFDGTPIDLTLYEENFLNVSPPDRIRAQMIMVY